MKARARTKAVQCGLRFLIDNRTSHRSILLSGSSVRALSQRPVLRRGEERAQARRRGMPTHSSSPLSVSGSGSSSVRQAQRRSEAGEKEQPSATGEREGENEKRVVEERAETEREKGLR
eukprot:198785-Rhodomonas_salina.1